MSATWNIWSPRVGVLKQCAKPGRLSCPALRGPVRMPRKDSKAGSSAATTTGVGLHTASLVTYYTVTYYTTICQPCTTTSDKTCDVDCLDFRELRYSMLKHLHSHLIEVASNGNTAPNITQFAV
eukprot:434386-Amphidinium_carterae.1